MNYVGNFDRVVTGFVIPLAGKQRELYFSTARICITVKQLADAGEDWRHRSRRLVVRREDERTDHAQHNFRFLRLEGVALLERFPGEVANEWGHRLCVGISAGAAGGQHTVLLRRITPPPRC